MANSPHLRQKGRGTALNVPNRFERVHVEADFEQVENDTDFLGRAESYSDAVSTPTTLKPSSPRTTAPTFPFATASTPIAAVPMAAATAMLGRITNIWE